MFYGYVFGLELISGFSSLFFKFLLCRAIYKDASERNDKNAVLWVVLMALCGIIAVPVYFIVRHYRKDNFVSCPHCGKMVSTKYPVCMFCKQPVETEEKSKFVSEEVKKYLIIAAIYYAVSVVSTVLFCLSKGQDFTATRLFI